MNEEFDDLIIYLTNAVLPTQPVKVDGYGTVTDPVRFLTNCRRRYKADGKYIIKILQAYKAEVQRIIDEATSD